MKVLMFGWEFPPHISGGLGTACYGLTKSLAEQNVEILFVMPRASGDEDTSIGQIISASEIDMPETISMEEAFWENVNFLPVDSGIVPYLGLDEYQKYADYSVCGTISSRLSHLGGKYTFSGKYGANLMEEVMRYAYIASQIAREQNFDVIHAHDWLTYLAGIVAKRISGKPLIVHVHATEFDRSGENINRMVYDLERMGMEQADAVVAVSNLTRNIVMNRYGIDSSRVFTVHNAVDFSEKVKVNKLVFAKKEKIITFLGRITFQKGPEYFVEAAYKVLKRCPNVRFVMAGSGDMTERMVARVAKLRIGKHFTFTGFLKGEDVSTMYGLSDVYVMPSVSEPFGISPLEAMRMNVPVIISKQSGVSEVLKHALKVDFWDIDALSDAMYALLNYPSLTHRLQTTGSEEIHTLSWANSAKEIKHIYSLFSS